MKPYRLPFLPPAEPARRIYLGGLLAVGCAAVRAIFYYRHNPAG